MSARVRVWPVLVRAALLGAAACGVGVMALGIWMMRPLPVPMIAPPRAAGIVIEDRHGVVLRSTRSADGSRERWISYDHIDPDLINAFVAVEDRRFWDHHGIDVSAVARAVRENFLEQHVVSGASTITMQLARIVRPASRTWGGKLVQAMWALRIERHLDKQQILEQYLNRVQLGQATIGVGAASAAYFDASAQNVSIAQAATLAGIAHAPSRDNPLTSARRARVRRTHALERMRDVGSVTREDVARAGEEPIRIAPRALPFIAPHFTTRVLSWVGGSGKVALSATVRTSIDAQLQAEVEAEVGYTVRALKERGVEDAAAVVLDNRTGGVLAWVGSPDFWSTGDGQTDMVVSARQPGSALKPFLYGLALDRGFTAATILPDIPKSYAAAIGSYTPRNYDRRFRGPVRAREALASSYNVPAVELASRVGTGSLLHTLRLAGFESLKRDAEEYGLGLALGNGDVTLLELANGYRAMANDGVWTPWTWRATFASPGSSAVGRRRVLSSTASAIVLDMLGDASARIPGFGVSTPFDFPFPVAVKTGTSRHFTDNWAVATTRGFTVAVWAGNFNGRPMQGVSGVTGAGPLLHRVVMGVAKYVSPGVLTTPSEAGAVSAPVCRLSGMRATPKCAQLTEWFVAGTQPAESDDWERNGGVTLPSEFAAWSGQAMPSVGAPTSLASSAREGTSESASARAADDAHPREQVRFRIVSPLDGDRYAIPPGVEARYATLSLRAAGAGAERVRWLVDGASHEGARWPLREGTHVIKAVSTRGESAETTIVVER
ncbi:MAG: penicillin-binding protein 1C [Gemmatimonadota bacterium]|nr:penicillin-binding protein 1C [Gemmatimonadota bacterium]